MSERPANAFAPANWPVWIGLGFLRVLVLLPQRARLATGRLLGQAAHAFSRERRAIVRRNIELCFPDLGPGARDDLARRHFQALGISIIELGMARWLPDTATRPLIRFEGNEHLDRALDEGRGIILLSAHFTTLEFSAVGLGQNIPDFDAVYRRNRSEFITSLLRTGRERWAANTIEKRDIRQMVRRLKNGGIVWYAPDQSFDRKGAVVVDFFGVPCSHTTATSTLARLGNAIVLPYFQQRLDDGNYAMRILPALEDFPGDDTVADTRRYVSLLEEATLLCPEQYFWVHRKFKNLPDGYPDYYADLDALK